MKLHEGSCLFFALLYDGYGCACLCSIATGGGFILRLGDYRINVEMSMFFECQCLWNFVVFFCQTLLTLLVLPEFWFSSHAPSMFMLSLPGYLITNASNVALAYIYIYTFFNSKDLLFTIVPWLVIFGKGAKSRGVFGNGASISTSSCPQTGVWNGWFGALIPLLVAWWMSFCFFW